MERARTCCFTGHRPDKLPWGYDEDDRRCFDLKAGMARALFALYEGGCRHFISGMALGADLYFAQAVLRLREVYPEVSLEAAVPYPGQADRWSAQSRRHWEALLKQCDRVTTVQPFYDRGCMLRRDRYMVDRSGAVLAVYAGLPGGTRYTLDYARRQGLDIRVLDPRRPLGPAADYAPEEEN